VDTGCLGKEVQMRPRGRVQTRPWRRGSDNALSEGSDKRRLCKVASLIDDESECID